ncbi:hypothetical protein SAY87_032039 [Trapa incisa]|uniref:Uncharacterized protein n=1 Tax=Trapa incisa TaxID=236973 RepID=A0AAN7KQP5_9MYRT|nr:hypothetical protein SAY87_032039 [Trapa incisa]
MDGESWVGAENGRGIEQVDRISRAWSCRSTNNIGMSSSMTLSSNQFWDEESISLPNEVYVSSDPRRASVNSQCAVAFCQLADIHDECDINEGKLRRSQVGVQVTRVLGLLFCWSCDDLVSVLTDWSRPNLLDDTEKLPIFYSQDHKYSPHLS